MKRFLTTSIVLIALLALAGNVFAAKTNEERIKDLEKYVRDLRVESSKDRIMWSGDLRIESHSITGEINDYVDGMRMQALTYGAMFYTDPIYGAGAPITSTDDIDQYIGANYANFQVFRGMNGFENVKDWVGTMAAMDPAGMGMMMQMFAADAAREGFKTDNDLLHTTRLRLNMAAKVAKDVSFTGRLSMYKPWGASTQTGIFNGQANTLNSDVNWPGVPGDATLKVDRAYFTWNKLFNAPVYLSLGRRPSTDGPPLHYRHDEVRQGTPMGTIIDFQFDGATLGWHMGEYTTIRACYGLGYESQYGQGMISTDNALKDAQFFGFNIDAYTSEEMQIQTTFARAFDMTDGFNGMIIMPNDPVSGQPMPGPIVTRFTPSANLGDFDVASVLLAREDGPFDWFVTGSWSKSHPENVTGPFGGLLSDPYSVPESQTGSMYYVGARYRFSNDKTKFGLEWNKGSEYWFNFAPSQDDIIAPKTSTRGTVIETYLTHRFEKKFVVKLAYINYDFDYSGTGWHVGAPKDLETQAITGYPTYSKASKFSLSFSARF